MARRKAQVEVLRPGSTPFFAGVRSFRGSMATRPSSWHRSFRVAVVYGTPLRASGAWVKGDLAGKICHDLPYMSCTRGYLIELSRCGHLKWTCVFVPIPPTLGRRSTLNCLRMLRTDNSDELCLCVTVAMPGGAKVVTYRGIEVGRQRYKTGVR